MIDAFALALSLIACFGAGALAGLVVGLYGRRAVANKSQLTAAQKQRRAQCHMWPRDLELDQRRDLELDP